MNKASRDVICSIAWKIRHRDTCFPFVQYRPRYQLNNVLRVSASSSNSPNGRTWFNRAVAGSGRGQLAGSLIAAFLFLGDRIGGDGRMIRANVLGPNVTGLIRGALEH